MVSDLDGDGASEAILIGEVRDSVFVVAIVASATRLVSSVLYRLSLAEAGVDYNGLPFRILSGVGTNRRIDAARGPYRYIRYQPAECGEEGWDWTVRKGKWLKLKSPCAYE